MNKMKKIISLAVVLLSVLTLSACVEADPCGEGTSLVDGVCVLDDASGNPIVNNGTVSCSNESGLHSVKGESPRTISSWLNWTFIGGHLVTDPDNAWIQDFGAAIFNVHTVAPEAWQGSFTQSGMFLTEGCEYTFTFTLRTEAPNIKPDVIVFGETTNGVSFFEEAVALEQVSTTYSYTVTPTDSVWVSTGVYFGGSTGTVVIEKIQITRDAIGTN
jgi:hypothetical protein